MRTSVVVAMLVLACGCGCGQSSGSDRTQIEGVFDDLQQSFAAEDVESLCDLTTAAAQKQVGSIGHVKPRTCDHDMRRFVEMVKRSPVSPRSSRPRVARLRITGDRAVATVSIAGRAPSRVPFAKEGGKWRVDAMFGGVPAGEQRNKFSLR